jgi:DNA-binding NarL/FixJ family response regulator
MLIARACQKLGDHDNARLELEASRQSFGELGAMCDLKRVQAFLTEQVTKNSGPLTEREMEVIQLVASGMTNRRIAAKLNISEKTVARHVSNIFIKLDLRSRSAATAYAYSHNLV